tara:strand:+ start:475 stop:780 length:306 start_codon:yes stop_codon:yes gene_type:complete
MQNIINIIPKFFKNKYVILILLFIAWIIFLDDYNLIKQNKMKKRVDALKKQKEFYITEKRKDSTNLLKLKNDSIYQEKFAREKFLMKKDNEDIFIIRKEKK